MVKCAISSLLYFIDDDHHQSSSSLQSVDSGNSERQHERVSKILYCLLYRKQCSFVLECLLSVQKVIVLILGLLMLETFKMWVDPFCLAFSTVAMLATLS